MIPWIFVLYAMDDGPGTDCKISVNEESGTEDLYCMLDVMEGDLWYHEIELEYNVPPGMCSYLAFCLIGTLTMRWVMALLMLVKQTQAKERKMVTLSLVISGVTTNLTQIFV